MSPTPLPTRVFLACGVTDMRKGFDGLAVLVQQVLAQSPHSGALFAFRGKRGHLVKLLWFDGQGLCLFSKRLDRGRFVWPVTGDAPSGRSRQHWLGENGGFAPLLLARCHAICYEMRVSESSVSPADAAALETSLARTNAALAARDLLIDTLRGQIARLRRMQFGVSSEKLGREIEQLELALEELETERDTPVVDVTAASIAARPGPVRGSPGHLPREDVVHEPAPGTVIRRFESCRPSQALSAPAKGTENCGFR
ncbi:hypothetical protein QE363_001995 [Sphingomonas sp. SORGH_AS870]|nr:hypothetical protein [Sphingomonas sp. SORGH_AS_0870]